MIYGKQLLLVLGFTVVTVASMDQTHRSKWVFTRNPTPVLPTCPASGDNCTVQTNSVISVSGTCENTCSDNDIQVTPRNNDHPCGDGLNADGCACCVPKDDTWIVPCTQICKPECDYIVSRNKLVARGRCALECDSETEIESSVNCTDNCKCCKPKFKKDFSDGEFTTTVVQNDPQFRNFDGTHFKYDGEDGCEYVLFQECVHHPSFSVSIRHHYVQEAKKMVVSEVSVAVRDIHITFIKEYIYVNGEIVEFPFMDGNLTVRKNKAEEALVNLDSKFSLKWNGSGRVVPVLDQSMFGKICGLMGNSDGNPDNDMQMPMPDGTLKQTNDIDEFGDSWLVPGSC